MRTEKITVDGKLISYVIRDMNGNKIGIISDFLERHTSGRGSPNTGKSYADDMGDCISFFNSKGIHFHEATAADIHAFRDHLLDAVDENGDPRYSDATVRRKFACVVSCYEYAKRHGDKKEYYSNKQYYPDPYLKMIMENPNKKIKLEVRLSTTSDKGPMKEESFEKLLSAAKTWRDKAILLLLRQGGVRRGEALGLHIDDIDMEQQIITVKFRDDNENNARVKNKSNREIEILEPEFWYALGKYIMEERRYNNPYNSRHLFLSLHGPSRGTPLKPDSLSNIFHYHGKKLGLRETDPNINPHALRHSHFTELSENLEGEEGLLFLQKRAGHRSLTSTMIYIHPSRKQLHKTYSSGLEKIQKKRRKYAV